MDIQTTPVGELYSFGGGQYWGAETSAADLIIPKLWLMQPMSDVVTKGIAKPGDIVNSLENTIVSDTNGNVDIIVYDSFKTVQTWVNDKWEKTESWSAELGALPYEEAVGGQKINRRQVLNFYCLLINEIKTETAFPAVVSFKNTSLATGRKLSTMITKARMMNQPSAAWVFTLGRTLEKNDKGSYFVFSVTKARSSTMEEVTTAKIWFDTTRSKKVTVDEKNDVV